MSILNHVGPWTEAEYLTLGAASNHVELVNGDLLIGALPRPWEHDLARSIADQLAPGAREAELVVGERVTLRLTPQRIVVADLVVRRPPADSTGEEAADSDDVADPARDVVDVSDVVLVAEILAAQTRLIDTVTKDHLYAKAGIRWYLLADPDPAGLVTLRWRRLEDGRYVDGAVAGPGTSLTLSEPFRADLRIDTAPARSIRNVARTAPGRTR